MPTRELNPGDAITNSTGLEEEYLASYGNGIIAAYTAQGYVFYYRNTSDADLCVGVPFTAGLTLPGRRAPRPGFDHLVLRNGEQPQAIQGRVARRADELGRAQGLTELAA